MGLFLLVLASLIVIVPGGAALLTGIGVPPQQGILFGSTQVALTAVLLGVVFQNRYNIWLLSTERLTLRLSIAGAAAGVSLLAYLFLYNHCVVEHPLYREKLLFPLWASGRLAGMIQKTGSRYGAVDMYGLAAVYDAISEMPGSAYALALGTLLLTYAPAIATACAVTFVLALRYPSQLFRPSTPNGKSFDVFLCYNRVDQLAVRAIAKDLAENGVRFFLDESENPPGRVWTEKVEQVLDTASSFAIFIGAAGAGRWQLTEIQNITEARMERGCGVIPVFLPDAPDYAKMPMQLAGLTWVDFRRKDPDPTDELIRGLRATSQPRDGLGVRRSLP